MTHPAHPLQSVLDALSIAHRDMQGSIERRNMQFIPENDYQDIQSVIDAIATIRAMMDVSENLVSATSILDMMWVGEPTPQKYEININVLSKIMAEVFAAGLAASNLSNGAKMQTELSCLAIND
jgi:hypothetical protein